MRVTTLSQRFIAATAALCPAVLASAANLLTNGSLDLVTPVEIVPGFFLPKPATWVNIGTLSINGPYEGEMSSESWAGPAPTPVTNGGFGNAPPYNSDPDWGVFFKPFSGNATVGSATGHLYQDLPGTAGARYQLTGWAGAEANAMMTNAVFAIEFRGAGGGLIQANELSLMPSLFVSNGMPFSYKKYTLNAVAPAGTVTVRVRASMLGGMSNPAGGGQAFVVDDFTLIKCPADLNGNGVVDGADLGILLSQWSQSGSADLDGSGAVNGADLALLLGSWGACP